MHASAHRLRVLAAGSDKVTEPPDEADDTLLRRVARHDRAAFEELYRRHRDKLVATSFRVVGDWHTAEQAEVAAALEELPRAHREVLTLMFVAELSHAEIGEVLGVPIGTVKSRLHAAKRGLAARLRARTAPGQGA